MARQLLQERWRNGFVPVVERDAGCSRSIVCCKREAPGETGIFHWQNQEAAKPGKVSCKVLDV